MGEEGARAQFASGCQNARNDPDDINAIKNGFHFRLCCNTWKLLCHWTQNQLNEDAEKSAQWRKRAAYFIWQRSKRIKLKTKILGENERKCVNFG